MTALRGLFNAKEAARILNICPKTLRREVSEGSLPFIRVGKRQKFDPRDIQHYIEKRRTQCRSGNEATQPSTGTIFGSKVVGIEAARKQLPAKRRA